MSFCCGGFGIGVYSVCLGGNMSGTGVSGMEDIGIKTKKKKKVTLLMTL